MRQATRTCHRLREMLSRFSAAQDSFIDTSLPQSTGGPISPQPAKRVADLNGAVLLPVV